MQNAKVKSQNGKSKIDKTILTCGLLVWALMLGVGINAVYPQDEVLNLDMLIKEAQANNPEILAAKKRLEAAKARIPQAKAWEDPKVGISVEKIPKGSLKLDRTMAEDRMLSVSQAFPLSGRLSLKGKIAVVESQISASEYKGIELEVINEVKKAYYSLFLNYEESELKKNSVQLLEDSSRVAEAKYGLGKLGQGEVLKLHLEIARMNNDLANLKEERKAQETELNTLLNRPAQAPLGLFVLEEDASFKADMEAFYQLALKNQPELSTFAYAIEKNQYAKKLAKRSVFPDLMAEIGLRGITAGGIGPWDLAMAVSLPFWFWTKQRYEIKEAVFNLEEAKSAYEAMRNKMFAQVSDIVSKIEIAKNKMDLSKTNLMPILESSISSSLAAFRAGRYDFMMLIDNERMYIDAKLDYYRALVEYNLNLSELEKEVGLSLRHKGDESNGFKK